jgi:hypothetical protein
MQAMVSGSKDPNVQWRVATEPNEKNFPSSLVSVANSWAAENMFSLFKLQSVLMEMNTGARDGIKTDCNFCLNGRKQSDENWNLNLTNLTHNLACPSSYYHGSKCVTKSVDHAAS